MRPPQLDDARQMWHLARACALDLNSPYAYLLWCRDFADTTLVSESAHGAIVGFVTGYRPPQRPDTIFVWQVAVAEEARRTGLGLALVDQLVERTLPLGVRSLEATITPSNVASRSLFEALARRRGATASETSTFAADLFPEPHEAELSIHVGPFDVDMSGPSTVHLGPSMRKHVVHTTRKDP